MTIFADKQHEMLHCFCFFFNALLARKPESSMGDFLERDRNHLSTDFAQPRLYSWKQLSAASDG